jgi:hypothetical protein
MATSLTYFVKNDLKKSLDPTCPLACNSVPSTQHLHRRKLKDPLFTIALKAIVVSGLSVVLVLRFPEHNVSTQ